MPPPKKTNIPNLTPEQIEAFARGIAEYQKNEARTFEYLQSAQRRDFDRRTDEEIRAAREEARVREKSYADRDADAAMTMQRAYGPAWPVTSQPSDPPPMSRSDAFSTPESRFGRLVGAIRGDYDYRDPAGSRPSGDTEAVVRASYGIDDNRTPAAPPPAEPYGYLGPSVDKKALHEAQGYVSRNPTVSSKRAR